MKRNFTLFRRNIVNLVCFFALIFAGLPGFSQVLFNATLDGPTGSSTPPSGWVSCSGSPDEQIISGTGAGIFGVNTPPSNGSSYVGLVTTSSGYVESFGQGVTFTAGVTYSGSVDIFREPPYPTFTTWNGFGRLQLFGGTSSCSNATLLWDSGVITNLSNWQTYNISFTPASNMTYFRVQNTFDNTCCGNYMCVDNFILTTVLPFNLVNYEAELVQENVELNWEFDGLTGNETFRLEYSNDGRNFQTIDEIASMDGQSAYTYLHSDFSEGMNFYRLQIIDVNGSLMFSETRRVLTDQESRSSVYPVPAQQFMNVEINMDAPGRIYTQIWDVNGKVVQINEFEASAGFNKFEINVNDDLANGSYYLQVLGLEFSEYHSVLIQR